MRRPQRFRASPTALNHFVAAGFCPKPLFQRQSPLWPPHLRPPPLSRPSFSSTGPRSTTRGGRCGISRCTATEANAKIMVAVMCGDVWGTAGLSFWSCRTVVRPPAVPVQQQQPPLRQVQVPAPQRQFQVTRCLLHYRRWTRRWAPECVWDGVGSGGKYEAMDTAQPLQSSNMCKNSALGAYCVPGLPWQK